MSESKPSYIAANATPRGISIHLDISSGGLNKPDADLDSTFSVLYRKLGTGRWYSSAPAARCHTGYVIDTVTTTYNFWAASCCHLEEDTTYQIRVNFYDPDATPAHVWIFEVTTDYYLDIPSNNKYCIPGTSGGDGSSGNPWQGLQTAYNNCSAGDNISCGNGTYAKFTMNSTKSGTRANPIRFFAENDRLAVIDAAAGHYGVEINPSSGTVSHIMIDGFEIKGSTDNDAAASITITDCDHITIQNCYMHDTVHGIRARGWNNDNIHHIYVYNNKMIGNTTWPRTDGGWDSAKGIWCSGNNDEYAYNTVTNFDDGISWESQNYDEVNYGCDIHHNFVNKIVDDGIEMDESVSNCRIYRNNVFNCRDAVSYGPIHGGPVYTFRNWIYNMETSGHKLTRGGTGCYLYNNSECMLGYGHVNSSSSKSTWNNTRTINTASWGDLDFYAQFGNLPDSTDHDWDWNLFYSDTYTVRYIWDNTAYTTAASLYAAHGLAQNDGTIDFTDVTTGSLPTDEFVAHSPGSYDFRPTVGSDLRDAGTFVPNLNDLWDITSNPTVGAFLYNETVGTIGCDF
jgi:hypothetical protein